MEVLCGAGREEPFDELSARVQRGNLHLAGDLSPHCTSPIQRRRNAETLLTPPKLQRRLRLQDAMNWNQRDLLVDDLFHEALGNALRKRSNWCVSANPNSHGAPVCLMSVHYEAPVSPSQPLNRMWSALHFATPAATTATPTLHTSFTFTPASGFAFLQSKINRTRSSVDSLFR